MPVDHLWLRELPWAVSSREITPVQRQVAQALKPFRLFPREGQRYHARHLCLTLCQIEMHIIAYGGAIGLDAGQLGNFSILHWPLVGSYVCQAEGEKLEVTSDFAHLIMPGVPIRMEWSADCVLLVVRFPAQGAADLGLEPKLLQSGGSPCGPTIDLVTGAGARLRRSLDFALLESVPGGLLASDVMLATAFQPILMAALKTALGERRVLEGGRRRFSDPRRRTTQPLALRRAKAILLGSIENPPTLGKLAKSLGVSERTLRGQFKLHHDMSPIAWLRTQRLDHVFQDLDQAQPGDDVTSVGLRWGFNNLGRLAGQYARRFGEMPSATLSRGRARSAFSD